ncbi:hypothetical protein IED13_17505 [Bosea sp. SSUT16]|uniref:Uncharacterized protein n=1 Tax=Bosea spartocytisi TaxID=2773451 RepID=A0A927EBC2_9HYPH|nr:hypothetical protein [Bosea spartocytisi]MBD3847500.1 hypothetical protein [Bosea spartocytisi]MCT4474564.1 hypothetical protein [Bosea spartocytisi]
MTARLTDLLTPDGRRALDGILAESRTMLGAIQPIQAIANRSIDLFDILTGGGVSPADICRLLAEGGILAQDGKALNKGTLTGALSRARKSVRRPESAASQARLQPAAPGCTGLQNAPQGCTGLQIAAADDIPLHQTSNRGDGLPATATGCGVLQIAAASAAPLQPPALPPASEKGGEKGGRGPPAPSQRRDGVSPAMHRGARLLALNNLENKHDEV